MILVRIRDGDKFEKISAQILAPGVKSGLAVTAPGHIARGVTLVRGGTRSEWRSGRCPANFGPTVHASGSRGARSDRQMGRSG
jgi:hypothetical protein